LRNPKVPKACGIYYNLGGITGRYRTHLGRSCQIAVGGGLKKHGKFDGARKRSLPLLAARLLLLVGPRLFILAVAPASLPAQISPGPLSAAHHSLDGPLQCANCHIFGGGKPQVKCLECHREIANRLTEKRGYHAAEVKPGSGSADCARCHSEHNGLNYRMLRWPVAKEKFDHAKAGWVLQGKHAELKCAQCHTAKYIDARDREVLKRKDLNTTYAGLETSCTACQKDVH
jgi:hypothetical protein